MRVRGFQTYITHQPNISAFTFTPFCIGWGERHDINGRVGVFDIVLLGFGLSFEWDKKGDISNDRGHTRIARLNSSGKTNASASSTSSTCN